MDIDQLQSVRDRERGTDSLQELREAFYEEATAFVADLRAERDRAASDAADPFDDPEVSRLTDRIRTAERTLEAIYEKRVGKIVKAATFAAADLPAEVEGMTAEEADLFETLVADIEANREAVLGPIADEDGPSRPEVPPDGTAPADDPPRDGGPHEAESGDADATGPPESGSTDPEMPDANPDPDDEADGPGGGGSTDADESTEPDPSGAGAADPDGEDADSEPSRTLVRITDDVGPILGVDDREYDLSKDDVVTLPAANARPLVERGAAERLE